MEHDQPSEPFGLALALVSKREATLQIQQVHYFMALCEELNFTCAARRCGVSQPSLSNENRHRLSGFMECRAAASVRLDVEGPDDVAPLLRFVGDELAEVGGRARKHSATKGRQAAPSFWHRAGPR